MFNQIVLSTPCSDSLPATSRLLGARLRHRCSEIHERMQVWETPRGEAVSTVRWASSQCRQCRCWIPDTSTVQAQCARRRWWIPCVGRSGSGKPIARRLGPSWDSTVGKDNANSWWSGRVEAGAVHLPRTISRNEIAEMCASEVLVAEGGALRWRPVDGLPKSLLGLRRSTRVHGRHFRTLSAHRRPFGLA